MYSRSQRDGSASKGACGASLVTYIRSLELTAEGEDYPNSETRCDIYPWVEGNTIAIGGSVALCSTM